MSSNKAIGDKIRSIRESQQLTIEAIAERSGLAYEEIQLIESNSTLPSLAPLIKLARALGVRLGTFLDHDTELGPAIHRNDTKQEAIRFSGESKSNGHMDFFALAEQKSGRHMDPFLIDIAPNETKELKLSSHEGEEFIYVLSGTLKIVYGKNSIVLKQGESIYYDSIVDHVVTAEQEPAKILAVVYTPA